MAKKRVSVKPGPDTCRWGKKNAHNKKSKRKQNEKCGPDGRKEKNKLTIKERNISFKSLSHGWTLHLHTDRDANSWHSFVPCNSFH